MRRTRLEEGRHQQLPAKQTLARPGDVTLLEQALPVQELSLVIDADRRAVDPAHGEHRNEESRQRQAAGSVSVTGRSNAPRLDRHGT
jgi:hypothetical protein